MFYCEAKLSAQWILVGPIPLSKGFADDGDRLRADIVRFTDISSGDERDVHRLKVATRNKAHADVLDAATVTFVILVSCSGDRPNSSAPLPHRYGTDVSGVGNTGECANIRQNLGIEGLSRSVEGVTRHREPSLHCQDRIGSKSRINGLNPPQCPNQ